MPPQPLRRRRRRRGVVEVVDERVAELPDARRKSSGADAFTPAADRLHKHPLRVQVECYRPAGPPPAPRPPTAPRRAGGCGRATPDANSRTGPQRRARSRQGRARSLVPRSLSDPSSSAVWPGPTGAPVSAPLPITSRLGLKRCGRFLSRPQGAIQGSTHRVRSRPCLNRPSLRFVAGGTCPDGSSPDGSPRWSRRSPHSRSSSI